MPLVRCPECRREISSQTTTCPHCGFPLKKTTQGMSGCSLFLLIVGAIITAVILISIGL